MKWVEPFFVPSTFSLPGLHPLVAEALFRRGITTAGAARAYLDPQSYTPASSASLPGLTTAADRLEMAIRKHQPICVWGDFDVDGQTSTTILFQTLQELEADVTYHIPIRASEGHGVNLPYLKEIINQNIRLVLTCDTGITAHAAVEYVRSQGVDMVITDHHDLPETLPQAAAVANPKLLPYGHPLYTLSGSGVAYKLSEELYARFNRPQDAIQHLDLAALGLVADLAHLTGDARYLVQLGLEALRKTQRLGLQVMMEMAELIPANLTEEHIGYTLGPRLNALGRLDDANPAVDLFTTTDPVRARVLVTLLEGLNAQRQLLTSQITRAAEAQLRADPALLDQPVLVLGHSTWPGGVVGIVASRLVERYRKPAILFSTPAGQTAHGSARSIEGLNITAAIAAQKDLLLNFGGHPMAAGLSLESDRLPEFTRRLAKTVIEMSDGIEMESSLVIDAWLDLPDITLDLARAFESLAPYGPGNEKLTLATHGLKLQSTATIGRNQEHLRLKVMDKAGNSQSIFWWNGAEEKDTISDGRFDLAYSLSASDWHGSPQVQMEFIDIHNLENEKIEVIGRQLEVLDYRNIQEPIKVLETLLRQSSMLLWAEGRDKKEIGGKERNELKPAEALAIWTIPPSPDELRGALTVVQPQMLYLFAVSIPNELPEEFIKRLLGLLKYAINQRAGEVSYSGLAAAMAQRLITVQKGVQWLASKGEIDLKEQRGDNLVVGIGSSQKEPATASRLWGDIQSLLAETAAYREYFKHADKDILSG